MMNTDETTATPIDWERPIETVDGRPATYKRTNGLGWRKVEINFGEYVYENVGRPLGTGPRLRNVEAKNRTEPVSTTRDSGKLRGIVEIFAGWFGGRVRVSTPITAPLYVADWGQDAVAKAEDDLARLLGERHRQREEWIAAGMPADPAFAHLDSVAGVPVEEPASSIPRSLEDLADDAGRAIDERQHDNAEAASRYREGERQTEPTPPPGYDPAHGGFIRQFGPREWKARGFMPLHVRPLVEPTPEEELREIVDQTARAAERQSEAIRRAISDAIDDGALAGVAERIEATLDENSVRAMLADLRKEARWIGGESHSWGSDWKTGAAGLDGVAFAKMLRQAALMIERIANSRETSIDEAARLEGDNERLRAELAATEAMLEHMGRDLATAIIAGDEWKGLAKARKRKLRRARRMLEEARVYDTRARDYATNRIATIGATVGADGGWQNCGQIVDVVAQALNLRLVEGGK